MDIQIFDDMSQCTEDEVNRMLALVSEQRRSQALKFKFTFGQFACLKSALMLQQMLTANGSIDCGTRVTFEFGPHGKPSIAGHPNIHFNISHCKHAIAVAVHDRPVGIDIESFRSADEALINKTMNEKERLTILSSPTPQIIFSELWTKKEAVLKLRGTGIIDELHDVLEGPETCETHTNSEKKYTWTVAFNR